MQKGDVLGHEFMGEVVEVGKDNARLKVGGTQRMRASRSSSSQALRGAAEWEPEATGRCQA